MCVIGWSFCALFPDAQGRGENGDNRLSRTANHFSEIMLYFLRRAEKKKVTQRS